MSINFNSLLTVVALVVAATSAYFTWQIGAERKIQDLQTDLGRNTKSIKELQQRLPPKAVPPGAVLSFNLEECPGPDWKEFKLGYGRFVRGIDRSGDNIDPSGPRTPGSLQSDEMKSHTHTTTIMVADPNVDGVDSTTRRSGDHHNQKRPTEHAGGIESRPKNVALLYCERV